MNSKVTTANLERYSLYFTDRECIFVICIWDCYCFDPLNYVSVFLEGF